MGGGWQGGFPHGSFVQKRVGRNQLSIVLIHDGHRPDREEGVFSFVVIYAAFTMVDAVMMMR